MGLPDARRLRRGKRHRTIAAAALCIVLWTTRVSATPTAADVEARVVVELARAETLLAQNRYRAALAVLERLERRTPLRLDVLAAHRRALATRTFTPREVAPLVRACESPPNREAALECARVFAMARDFPRALALAAGTARYDPAASAALSDIGRIARDAGEIAIAATCAERAYVLAPDLPERTIEAARYRIASGQPASASALLEPLLVAQPTSAPARAMAAEASLLAGDHERAIAHYALLEARCPADQAADCLADLATSQLYGGHLDAAIETATRATRIACPFDPRPHRVLGLALVRRGREALARDAFDESLRRRDDAVTRALRRALDDR